jgi:hypothetical protein
MSAPQEEGLRIAVLAALIDAISSEATRVRTDGKEGFRLTRAGGVPYLWIMLPGSDIPLGQLRFKGGTPGVDVKPDDLLAWAQVNDPGIVEDYLDSTIVTKPEVLALIKKHLPHLVRQRVKGDEAAKLAKRVDKKGRLTNLDTGESAVVGTAKVSPVTGDVAWYPAKDATGRIMAALGNGTLSNETLRLWPLARPATAPEPPAKTIRAIPAGPPPLEWDGRPVEQPTFDDLLTESGESPAVAA